MAEYQKALLATCAIIAPAESRIAAYLSSRRLPLDYRPRRRMPDLIEDLHFYGLTPPRRAWPGPVLATDADLVGCLYVLEGGTRASRFIFQRMTKALGITEERGGQYFNGYGDRTEAMWQEFWSFAAEYCPSGSWADACQAAITFMRSYRDLLDRIR
jgi:heme oxygenase